MPRRTGAILFSSTLSAAVPATGLVVPYSGDETKVPDGWVVADGAPLSRTTYPMLFRYYESLGFLYGAGDGITTFGIPDLRGRVPHGTNVMGGVVASRITAAGSGWNGDIEGIGGGWQSCLLSMEEMPSHNHTFNSPSLSHSHPNMLCAITTPCDNDSPFWVHGQEPRSFSSQGANVSLVHNHAISNDYGIPAGPIGSAYSHNNMPPAIIGLWIIKT